MRLRQGQFSFANTVGLEDGSQNASRVKMTSEEEKVYAEQISYYKETNKELEERINQHITVNSELKIKLEAYLKGNGGKNSSTQYLKDEITNLETTVVNLNARINRLTEENKNIRNEIGSKKLIDGETLESKVFTLEGQIQEMNRRISQLNLEKKSLQNEKVGLEN